MPAVVALCAYAVFFSVKLIPAAQIDDKNVNYGVNYIYGC